MIVLPQNSERPSIIGKCAAELDLAAQELLKLQEDLMPLVANASTDQQMQIQKLDELNQLISIVAQALSYHGQGRSDLSDLRPKNLRDRLLGKEHTAQAGSVDLF